MKKIIIILTISLLSILSGNTRDELIYLPDLTYDEASWDDSDKLFLSKHNFYDFSERGKTLVMLFFEVLIC